jgi:hypothetical protein
LATTTLCSRKEFIDKKATFLKEFVFTNWETNTKRNELKHTTGLGIIFLNLLQRDAKTYLVGVPLSVKLHAHV